MTGFGRGVSETDGYMIYCEIKGLNHRYLDISIRIPRYYALLEDKIKAAVRQFINRGRVEINIEVKKTSGLRHSVKLDKELAITYYNNLNDIADILSMPLEVRTIDLFRLPEVFSLEEQEEDMEKVWRFVEKALLIALEDKVAMRRNEGAYMVADIKERNLVNIARIKQLEERAPRAETEYRNKLRQRMRELFAAGAVDEQRLWQEAAIFADKSNVTEEIVRLRSHIKYLDELLETGGTVGRKCDFLLQEMFREINTVASKSNDLEMSQIAVDVKAELEKIREQVQNIE
ncbi:MAG: YicC family protein [Syntrophomonadaceae bacterium]|nr:YicC family protein [Syntrophomonadaceae bacterium]